MVVEKDGMSASPIPREMFLGHSDILLEHLISQSGEPLGRNVLELGCGPASSWLGKLRELNPDVSITQVDARAEVLEKARLHAPDCRILQRFAYDLHGIAAGSQDAVIAMSVYDQNPSFLLPPIAREIRRVLRPGGLFLYLHNEEFNLPSAAASRMYKSMQPLVWQDEPCVLLPNDRWRPDNDWEYGLVKMTDMNRILNQSNGQIGPLMNYLHQLYPNPAKLSGSESSGINTSRFAGAMTVEQLKLFRDGTAALRRDFDLPMEDCGTAELLAEHVERGLVSQIEGAQILRAGMFRIEQQRPWREVFHQQLERRVVVRGVARFGYLSDEIIRPASPRCQLCGPEIMTLTSDQVLLIGLQYGVVARC